MPAYKDQNKGTWYCKFVYKDWQGNKKHKCKRGFKTKREALEYEQDFKVDKADDVDMSFEIFVKKYKEDLYPRIRLSTSITKDHIIDNLITPFFINKKISEITSRDVIRWQNTLIGKINPHTGKRYKSSYLKTVHNQLSAIFNFGVRFYSLKTNPAAQAGNMGSEKDIKVDFWTETEYYKFRDVMMDDPFYYYIFETLYWTGIREGELLALQVSDINFKDNTISIDKTYQVLRGEPVITPPKTPQSVRVVTMPSFLADELKDYIGMIYKPKSDERLFPSSKSCITNCLKTGAKKAGVKTIRVYDLRHSHVSLLINNGYSPMAIGARVGHKSIDITIIYEHMFPNVQKDLAATLNDIAIGGDNYVGKE